LVVAAGFVTWKWQEAEAQRARAETNESHLIVALGCGEKTGAELQRTAYFDKIAAAHGAFTRNDLPRMAELLAACPAAGAWLGVALLAAAVSRCSDRLYRPPRTERTASPSVQTARTSPRPLPTALSYLIQNGSPHPDPSGTQLLRYVRSMEPKRLLGSGRVNPT